MKRKQIILELEESHRRANVSGRAASSNHEKHFWQGRASGILKAIVLLKSE
jgi:hypothetical protein